MYTIKNNLLSISISGTYCLEEITDLSTGKEYISKDITNKPLFKLICTEVKDKQVQPGEFSISSKTADNVTVKIEDRMIEIIFYQLDGLAVDVHCYIEISPELSLSYWKIKIDNNSKFAIKAIEYPIIYAAAPLSEDAENDRILIPKQDGYLLPSPLAQEWQGDYPFRRTNQRFHYPGEGRQFPAALCAQLLAYYNDNGGIYVATHDGEGHPKQLGPIQITEEDKLALDFTPVHLLPEEAGNSYTSLYETVLGCFKGDWQDAADIYKTWSIQQPWCSTTLQARDDVPAWIKEGAYFFNFRLRHQADGENFLERIPEYLKEWQKTFEFPLVAMMCGWEKFGEWAGPDYFPPFGTSKFEKLCRTLKEMGIYLFPFGLSGLKLPIRKRIGRDWPQPELAIDYDNRAFFEKYFKPHAVTDSAGNTIIDSYIASWDGLHGYACVSTSQAWEQLYGASMRLVKEYGAIISQADQIFGGAAPECYHPEHGHTPGRGKWQVDNIRRIYDKIRADAKKTEPNFALSQEFPCELFIQYLDVCHGRISDQPRGIWGVPLFSYLYHEYLSCYGGDWSSLLEDNTCGVYVQANNFVFGSQPAGCPQTMFKNTQNKLPQNCDAEIIDMAKNTCALFSRFAHYLILGKMCKTRALDVPNIQVNFMGMDFAGWKKKPIQVPAVLHCLWQAQNKDFAYALANISDIERRVTVPCHHDVKSANLWINREKEKKLIKSEEMIVFSLKPCDAAILELNRVCP